MNEFQALVHIYENPTEIVTAKPDGTERRMLRIKAVDGRSRYNEEKGEWEKAREPLWLNLAFFDHGQKLYERAHDELRAGMQIRVIGELQVKKYEKDGEERTSLDLYVRSYYLAAGSLIKLFGGPLPLVSREPEDGVSNYDEDVLF